MELTEILRHVDHTLLKQTATCDEIKTLCADAARFHTASVCVPPCYVRLAAQECAGIVKVCTVVGFPNGNSTPAAKVFEAREALANGADEIDTVINVGWLKDKRYSDVLAELKELKAACGDKVLKVIIETCLLTDEEKIKMCEIVTEAGADYIKTSTGFSTGGATFADVRLFRAHIGPGVKIKAAGGIQSLEDAETFLQLGADRLGTSRIVALAKAAQE